MKCFAEDGLRIAIIISELRLLYLEAHCEIVASALVIGSWERMVNVGGTHVALGWKRVCPDYYFSGESSARLS